uniref:Acetyl-coenzyme A carboxylase carboxyl transferase subunit beta, chloroplastic n=1 Tax=Hetaeria oblongifolia TaxID=1127258 RepID=A0A8F5P7D8_9ASPA|nr:acetyl-CoA carboxylase carboxyl transferase [Hetaeria oblongifolia]
MKKCWFNSMLFNKKLEHKCGLSKSMDSLDALGHTGGSEEPFLNDAEKKIPSWDSSSLSNIHYLNYFFDSRNILSLIYDDTFLVRNSNGDSYSLYFDIENQIFDIDNAIYFLSELDIFFSNYLNSGSNSINYYSYDTKSNWNNHINSCIDTYLLFEISLHSGIDSYIKSFICTESENLSIESEISNIESENLSIESEISNIESENLSIESEISNIESEISNDFDRTAQYKELWVLCENCYGLNYKKFFSSKMNICEYCGDHLKMSSSDRIKLLIDPGTWESMDEDMVSVDPIEFDSIDSIEFDSIDSIDFNSIDPNSIDFNSIDPNSIDPNSIDPNSIDSNSIDPNSIDSNSIDPNSIDPNSINPKSIDFNSIDFNSIDFNSIDFNLIEFNLIDPNSIDPNSIEFDSEEEPYIDRIPSYQRKTGLTEAVQTGIGKLNSIPVAIGVMDFQFMGGSMGSVVGEKITRLIEYATNRSLPVIIVCASGGARMQEGSLSLMQMAKISSASYDYQSKKKLFYISILTSPTTGGVTASFGMLGDIIIAEPNAHIAFAGKRVIEEILKTPVPDGLQVAENSFDKGLFDPIVPRNPLKGVLNELFQLHGFLPLNQD